MTLDDARAVVAAIDDGGSNFFKLETMGRLQKAFPEFHWGWAPGCMHLEVRPRLAQLEKVAA